MRSPPTTEACPLCGRELDESANEHHLVPKSLGGRETVTLHRICHHKIHSVFTERELKAHYHTIARILERDEMASFVAWVAAKPPAYYSRNERTKSRRRR